MTNYRPSHLSAEEGDPQLVEELNSFFACFEAVPTVAATPHTNARYKVVPTEAATATPHTPTQSSIVLKEHEGCVLSPLLYSLYTHHFSAAHPSNSIIKFADDTTVVGCISRGDETAYRDEVEQLLKSVIFGSSPDVSILYPQRRYLEAVTGHSM
ncbi:hypothetical protein SKAU_G00209690 [Synaphobranchus kaupii]|uniref:Reverse transcriptase domain-containing protein n=1 Tax=Synaphobranchus kaupii TaxID=118154 RepID=A0A9Q1ITX5_SYNKA|nr:hypothetical protein SKAU_G00209690 [Synaphobranchus kaupii]